MGDISTAFVQQYGTNIASLVQQRGSKLRSAVYLKTGVVGKTTFVDQLGSTTAQRKTTRNSDTPLVKSNHARRMISMYEWEWADLLDKADDLKTLIDPTSSYTLNAVYALGRAIDADILDSASGTAYAGETGSTSTTLGTAQQITAGSSGLTLAKLLTAKKILDNNDVDDMEERYIVVTGTQLNDLLNTTQATSADYNSVRALVNGQIDTFAGFKFKLCSTSVVNTDTNSARLVIAWAKNGLALAMARDITTKIDQRADKSYATQVYAAMDIGSTRLEEARVVEIACAE